MGRKARLKRERRAERDQRRFQKAKERENLLNLITSNEAIYSMRRAMLRSGAKRNSCIMATRMFVEMATRMGFVAYGMTVETTVFNEPLWDWLQGQQLNLEQKIADLDEHLLRGAVQAGGRMVVLGARDNPEPTEPGNWPGHLVAVVGERAQRHWRVVDLTLDQATRPEKEIVVRPSCFVAPEEWLDGGMVARGFRHMGSLERKTVIVEYVAYPEDKSYFDAPDWKRSYNALITTSSRGIQFTMDRI